LFNTLDAESSLEVVREAVATHGPPGILNSDQGSQFTCADYFNYLKGESIKLSMDRKGGALDNIYIERFWRTIKYQHIYLTPPDDGLQLYRGIAKWLEGYHNRKHQGQRTHQIHCQTPKNSLFIQSNLLNPWGEGVMVSYF
jgi:putative transposase